MANKFLKSNQMLILVVIVLAAGAFLGWKYLQSRKYALPGGIASGNGRVEAKLVDATAQEQLAVVNASIAKRKSEVALAKIEADRAQKMLQDNASSQREVDVRRTTVETTTAALDEARAQLQAAT